MLRPAAIAAEQGEREDADIGDDEGQFDGRLFGALGPDQAEPGPERECGEEPQHTPGNRTETLPGQDPHERPEHEDPPDGDSDLVVDEGVVTTTLEPEVGKKAKDQNPGPDDIPVDSTGVFLRG